MGARILIVEDEKLIRWSMSQALEQLGHVVEQAETAGAALEAVEREAPDLILLDYKLPDRTGTEIMPELRRISPHMPVIMITAHASIPGAVEALKEGVCDYISKPFEINELLQAVSCALEASRLRDVVAWHGGQAMKCVGAGSIVAKSKAMQEVMRMVKRIAESGAHTVLLLGESGVGKGVIARAIHHASDARGEAFMNISCTSLSDQLLESELFGHERGAFTDAKNTKKGLVELADHGTVFLDEIGDISMLLQSKLLGFLEDRTFRRVGGVRDIRVNLRVIAATNKDLEREVSEGRFRGDLYYRLKVIPIRIPPLRDRRDDIPELAMMFIEHFNLEFGKSVTGVDEACQGAMRAYTWPGNVRELRNAIERAVLLSRGERLTIDDLPSEVSEPALVPVSEDLDDRFELPAEGIEWESLEQHLVRQALHRTRGNRARAARLLGMNRDQMRYRIKKFGLVEFMEDEV